MSAIQIDLAQISREARRIVDAKRASTILAAANSEIVNNGESSSDARKRIKYTRTTTGCLECRKHKIKCDETPPVCLRCLATQRRCQYPTPKESASKKRKTGSRKDRDESAGVSTEASADQPVVELPNPLQTIAQSFLPDTAVNDLGSIVSTDSTGQPPILDFFSEFITTPTPPFTIAPSAMSLKDFTPFYSPSTSADLPADLSRSLLHSRRRAGKTKPQVNEVGAPLIRPRAHMVPEILQAFVSDESLFEFGPSSRARITTPTFLNSTTTDVLSNAFPSSVALSLFNHYCNTASRILVTMGNIGPNPLITICTPMVLLDTSSAASAAIRMSILSTSVAHLAYGIEDALAGAHVDVNVPHPREALMSMSIKFKKAALANIMLATSETSRPDQVNSVLAACTLLCIRDVVSADPSWRENLDFVINFINKKGGPQSMLNGVDYSFTRRYLLENLAIHDVFSCFITGKEPSLLGNYDPWWFESVETSQTRWEWESVERSFGLSRAMVDLIARILVVDSKKRRLKLKMSDSTEELSDVVDHIKRESHCLLLELDIWGNSLSQIPQNIRISCGDYIYRYMAVVFIFADILEQPITNPRVVKSVDCILELLSEANSMRMSVMLIWPILIAGTFGQIHTRKKVIELFDAFRGEYCEDLTAAREVLMAQWKSIDSGRRKLPWHEAMRRAGRDVLLI